MTVEEFKEAVGAYHRKSLRACVVPLLVALGMILGYVPFKEGFEAYLAERFEPVVVTVFVVLPMAVPMVGGFLVVVYLGFRVGRRAGVACPSCGEELGAYRAIVIASGNCPHCGGRVIDR